MAIDRPLEILTKFPTLLRLVVPDDSVVKHSDPGQTGVLGHPRGVVHPVLLEDVPAGCKVPGDEGPPASHLDKNDLPERLEVELRSQRNPTKLENQLRDNGKAEDPNKNCSSKFAHLQG